MTILRTKTTRKSLNINKEAPKFENNIEGDKTPKNFFEMLNFGNNNNKNKKTL
jgi:hypothetical protein